MRVSGVILAAGQSSRLGRPKQLLPLDGKPIVRITAEQTLASSLDEVILVTGAAGDEVAAAVADLPVRLVHNPSYAEGQSTSLKVGLAAVSPDIDAVMFLLGDQPEVGPEIIDALIAKFKRTGSAIVQPVYGKVPGNPVLFGRALFSELVTIEGDQGARSLLRQHIDKIAKVAIVGASLPGDVDTEKDYHALVKRWADCARRRASEAD
jgi:molybdenum cofactor cytidylyltransferase